MSIQAQTKRLATFAGKIFLDTRAVLDCLVQLEDIGIFPRGLELPNGIGESILDTINTLSWELAFIFTKKK